MLGDFGSVQFSIFVKLADNAPPVKGWHTTRTYVLYGGSWPFSKSHWTGYDLALLVRIRKAQFLRVPSRLNCFFPCRSWVCHRNTNKLTKHRLSKQASSTTGYRYASLFAIYWILTSFPGGVSTCFCERAITIYNRQLLVAIKPHSFGYL